MKYLTKKYFTNLEKSLIESNQRALSTRLTYIGKLREDEYLRKPINDSVYAGSLLTKLLDCIPKEILKDNIGTRLFTFEEYKKETEKQKHDRNYFDFFLVPDTVNFLEKTKFYIFRPHKRFALRFFDFENNEGARPVTEEWVLNTINFKEMRGYALNSEGQIRYLDSTLGRLKIANDSIQYLTTYLAQDNILLEYFVKEVSENLIKIAEKGRTNESLLKETLHNISLLPEDWIMEKLKK